MPANLTEHLAAQHAPLKAALNELVRIPSACAEGEGGYPFGAGVDQALRATLRIAGDLGFRTYYDADGYYGYAEIGEGTPSTGSGLLGVLGHLDVVPPGKLADWTHDPFEPVEVDGLLYGRGTQDDKGPLLAALFAVKALIDAGVKFNGRIRFIFGTDEETLWRCINRYKEREELPDMGFSPDARFPLIFAEKGLLQLHLEGEKRSGLRMAGGSAFNAVPDMIIYEGERQDELARKLDALGFAYSRAANRIEVRGKAAHAMIPEEGVNAQRGDRGKAERSGGQVWVGIQGVRLAGAALPAPGSFRDRDTDPRLPPSQRRLGLAACLLGRRHLCPRHAQLRGVRRPKA